MSAVERVSRLEGAVVAHDYIEEAEGIRDGKKSLDFAFRHGKTVGTIIHFCDPGIANAFIATTSKIDTLPQVTETGRHEAVVAWATMDSPLLRDLRSHWPIQYKSAFYAGVFAKGGPLAVIMQLMTVEGLKRFNNAFDSVDLVASRALSRAVEIARRGKNKKQ
jgi:hypothetical protein